MEDEEREDGDFTSVGKGGKPLGFTPDSVFKNLQTVQESRGKKVVFHFETYIAAGLLINQTLRTQIEPCKFMSWKSCLRLPIPRTNVSVSSLHLYRLDLTTTHPCQLTCLSISGSRPSVKSTS